MYKEFTMKGSSSLIKAVLSITIILGVVIFISALINGTKKESEVLIKETTIEINGQFGTSVNIADIKEIHLVDTMPAVGNKVNGVGLGEIKKGEFDVEGLGTCKLFIHSSSGPFVFITLDNQTIIMNFKDTNKTVSVYEEINSALQGSK